jgi:putative tryptophan/tyrosine transport system substrate-binding protein
MFCAFERGLMAMRALTWRALVAVVCGAALPLAAMPAAAQPDAKISRVGVLLPGDSDKNPSSVAFRKALQDLGYVEGKSIILDFRLAKGHNERLGDLAAELVRIPVDLIVAGGTTAVRAAAGATKSIPIIQAAGGDLVNAGLAASLARPGGNVTGFTIRTDEPSGKRVELLKRAFPSITQVTVMLDPTSVVTQRQLRATERAATTLGINLAKLPVGTPEELDALRPAALAGSDGLVVLPSALFWSHRATVIALAAAARIPAIYPEREFADEGGLVAYGANIPDAYRRSAGYVDRILRGTKAGELPIEEASKFDFVVNLRAAKQLGLSPSNDFMVGADEVIE